MRTKERLDHIAGLVEDRGFLSVVELSRLCAVSEMTIRRDLDQLDQQKRLQRIYEGAASLRGPLADPAPSANKSERFLVDRVDVLVASSVNPTYDRSLLERIGKKNIPIIAESLAIRRDESVVTVDNYQAGVELGRWAGQYA